MNFKTFSIASVALLASAAIASAASIINIGNIVLLPDTAGQQFNITVQGGDAVQGLSLFAQVADGGAEVGGTIDGPAVTEINSTVGTIFNGNNTGEGGQRGAFAPQLFDAETTTVNGTVPANGLLAVVTIDTRGFSAGQTFDFKITGTAVGDSAFTGPSGDVPITVTNGTISLVAAPEPTAIGFIGLGGLVALRRRRNRA